MNNRRSDKNFLYFGLTASLSWHLFWAFLIVPVVNDPLVVPLKSRSVFLGPILENADFSLNAGGAGTKSATGSAHGAPQEDFSREKYFTKNPQVFYKPNEGFSQKKLTLAMAQTGLPVPGTPFRPARDISFGFSDFPDYLSGTDFSDLKKITARLDEELSGFIEFKVWLTPEGRVRFIKKTVSSGDPSLDLSVMLRLKKAVFRPVFIPSDHLVNVRFWIKK
jgi:hypothetical protein